MPSKPCSSGLSRAATTASTAWGTTRSNWLRLASPRIALRHWTAIGPALHSPNGLPWLWPKLTVAPHTITDADIDAVRQHFSNQQVLEIVGIVAGFNAMNRWTGPLRLTQEDFRLFLTPTSPDLQPRLPALDRRPAGRLALQAAPRARPPSSLGRSSKRNGRNAEAMPRFPLVDESATRGILPEDTFAASQRFPTGVAFWPISPKPAQQRSPRCGPPNPRATFLPSSKPSSPGCRPAPPRLVRSGTARDRLRAWA